MPTLKKPAESQAMNKQSWQGQKVIRDVETWRCWLTDSADKFIVELKELSQKRGMPVDDVVNLNSVREELAAFRKHLTPLEKSIHKATGRRIQRAKRR